MRAPRQSRRQFCTAVGLIAFANSVAGRSSSAVGQPSDVGRSGSPFILFDALLFQGKPDLRPHGVVPIDGSGELWRPGVSTDSVDEVRIRSLFGPLSKSSGFYYIDIENWPLQSVAADVRRDHIAKLTRLIDLAHDTAPSLHIGFYGILPGITYWPLMHHDGNYEEWLRVNRQLDPLAARVDAVFPSLYTFYPDPAAWKSYARQTLTEARRYGKPVYAFLWPEFHDSNRLLRGHPLPPPLWRAELELCAELAAGVVLWGGWKEPWNDNAPWWQETLAFMRILASADRAAG